MGVGLGILALLSVLLSMIVVIQCFIIMKLKRYTIVHIHVRI